MININKILKRYKIITIVCCVIVLISLIVGIPSLAKLKHRNSIYNVTDWDGSIADSYKKGNGTEENPFIISSGSEFAFFLEQLKGEETYENKFFELGNDIVLNSGIFSYDQNEGLKYLKNDIIYYIKKNTNKYYADPGRQTEYVGEINQISSIKNFKGTLNGNSFTIFGLYLIEETNENLALFQNLEGTIKDIYISNSVVDGKGNVAGIAVNSKDAIITNVLYDGIVINSSLEKIINNQIDPFLINSTLLETMTEISVSPVSVPGTISKVSITGEWISEVDELSSMKLIANGKEYIIEDLTSRKIDIELDPELITEMFISTTSNIDNNSINFSNLNYKIEYYDDVTSGIISSAENVSLTNVINKSKVYGNYVTAGLVGETNGNLKITQSYNTGDITSKNISSGIVGIIENNETHTTLLNVYNKGIVNSSIPASIIGVAKNNIGLINITNVINAIPNYAINTVENSTINVVSSYGINNLSVYNGILQDGFEETVVESLYTKEFMEKIGYNEFTNLSEITLNPNNVWIFEDNSLPILYIDNLNNPVANININKYSWNNLSTELDVIGITNSITFSIEPLSPTTLISEKYYFISNDRTPLTEEKLNNVLWIKYDEPVKIQESGYYVVYAKILDTDGNTTYINTDIMMLNVSGFTAKITMNNKEWTNFKTDLENMYINNDMALSLIAHDDLLTITSLEYFISDKKLTEEEVKNITSWTSYINPIEINQPGKYIVYAKIIDNESTIRYINTDYLLYNGYTESINLGTKGIKYDTNYIKNNSSINLDFESDFEIEFLDGYSHNFVSNILLPEGTLITLIDKNSKNVYKLEIKSDEDLYGYNDSCLGVSDCTKYATYSFNLFKQIGILENKNYDESLNYGKIINQEKFKIIIDFSESIMTENYYDVSFYLAMKNNSDKFLYKTLNNTIGNVNIYSTLNDEEILTKHLILSDYNNQNIYYNSNSETNINLTNSIIYSEINGKNIIDTTYEMKKTGIIIKICNEENEIINKKYLDNLIFEVNGVEYFSNSDNVIKINLGNVTDNLIKTLKIKTKENSSGLKNGTYSIIINEYISDDGYYYDKLYSDEIVIPLIVTDQNDMIYDYTFSAEINSDSIILNKKENNHITGFNIIYNGSLNNPLISVSLYEKVKLTAYDQEYKIVDLQEYTSDTLIKIAENQYQIPLGTSIFNINLIMDKFNNNGYKYLFELYDGTNKISEVHKYFIVK